MMKAVGGEVGAASALAPKVGPLGLVYLLFLFILVTKENRWRYSKSHHGMERFKSHG